jgi:hypothetical protein
MRRLLLVAGLVAGSVAVAPTVALTSGTPGPNGHNDFGLCTAYSSGSSQGQSEKQAHGQAFLGLEAAAKAANETVAQYCAANGTQP